MAKQIVYGEQSRHGRRNVLRKLGVIETVAAAVERHGGAVALIAIRGADGLIPARARHVPNRGDHIMSEYRDAVVVGPSPAETAPTLTFDERWAQWQAKGARDDVRVARNMRLIAAITLTIGVIIWASVALR